MNNYIPLQVRTDASLLKSATKPEQIAKRLKEIGIERCALTDINTLASAVSFLKEVPKGILGCQISTYGQDVTLLAKNKAGWNVLLKMISDSNSPIGLDLSNYDRTSDIICICKYDPKTWIENFDDVYLGLDYTEDIQKMREYSDEVGFPGVAMCNSYYMNKSDAEDQRVVYAVGEKKTLYDLRFEKFMQSDDYFLPSPEEMLGKFKQEEIDFTNEIGDMCEEIKLDSPPQLPNFECPNGLSDIEYLKQLCNEGFAKKVPKDEIDKYKERIQYEVQILEDAGLASYFLIVRDIIKHVQDLGFLTGVARGSAAGCLVSYFIDVTQIDPLKYDLIFERFYDVSRKGSLPDIDIDMPHAARAKTMQYLKEKYGKSNVSQLVTFQTMQGRNALKNVLRVHDDVSFAEMNRITQYIIDKAKISDELADLDDKSLIRYALEHRPHRFEEWCIMGDDGKLYGPLATRFEQAIRLEGTRTSQSKHPAGVVITEQPLSSICPMVWDNQDKQMVAGMEMNDLESMGMVKIDVLGIAMLDKLMDIQADLKKGIQFKL